jgi:hypothetical protein
MGMSIKPQMHFWPGRVLVWFSCGAPSAVADFPAVFLDRAKKERQLGRRIMADCYLDELDPNAGNYDDEPSIECGAVCIMPKE